MLKTDLKSLYEAFSGFSIYTDVRSDLHRCTQGEQKTYTDVRSDLHKCTQGALPVDK